LHFHRARSQGCRPQERLHRLSSRCLREVNTVHPPDTSHYSVIESQVLCSRALKPAFTPRVFTVFYPQLTGRL
jgi:hypothetical protein